jgi:hypothetical protein
MNDYIPGISEDWFEHTAVWESEMRKNRRPYLCLFYEEIKKVLLHQFSFQFENYLFKNMVFYLFLDCFAF